MGLYEISNLQKTELISVLIRFSQQNIVRMQVDLINNEM
jgi:hypothetical protein